MIDTDELFKTERAGLYALIGGMSIIGIVIYFIYLIMPLWNEDPMIFFFSFVTLLMGVLIPVFFFLRPLTGYSGIVGKFVSGVITAIIIWLGYHLHRTQDYGPFELTLYIALPTIFTAVTSFILVRGVIMPLMEEREMGGYGWEEEFEEEDIELDEEFEEETTQSDTKREKGGEKEKKKKESVKEDELFPEEMDEDW